MLPIAKVIRRTDEPAGERFFDLVTNLDLSQALPTSLSIEKTSFGILGFCCDEGVRRNQGRVGAKDGPSAFRDAFIRMPIPVGFSSQILDCGDVEFEESLESTQLMLAQKIQRLKQLGLIPVVIGGGHEVAFGHYQGLAPAHPRLAVVNFDAHLDLRLPHEGLGNSGTPFFQIHEFCERNNRPFSYSCIGVQPFSNLPSLFKRAEQIGASYLTAEEVHKQSYKDSCKFLDKTLKDYEDVYITVCLDVFSGAFAPGVSAQNPVGLNPYQVIPLIKHLLQYKKIAGFEIAELAPGLDINHMTAKLAASILVEVIAS